MGGIVESQFLTLRCNEDNTLPWNNRNCLSHVMVRSMMKPSQVFHPNISSEIELAIRVE
jgi:hypothetical protein